MLDIVNVVDQEQNWLISETLVNIVKFESCHWTSKMKVDIFIYPRDHICRKVPQKTLNSNLPFKRRQMGYDLLRCYMVRYIEKISRLKKQEVEKLSDDAFEKVVETVKKDMAAKKPPEPIVLDDPTESETKKSKEKICIMVQEKDGRQQFRVCKDEKFDKLFKAYAKKVQVSPSDLTFVFDGDKINPASTPQDLDLEDEDMIEVHHKPTLGKPAEAYVKKSREKILIMIQDKDVKLQFRVYKDEKFDKLFKVYAKKVQLKPSDLIFIFDGDKINSASTPQDLDLENDDMIEVRHKSH
ncbi:NFATC2-interacting protein isoform X2 [Triticum urartu]|uniref:NFATC2-interacting protein isoform X2 n=1 Tax=Triticum urartu TaxID=4572 RepID=UPI002043A9D5|nr:NFATC2-interacting protein isoform X2 [Triticum urartu]